MIVNQVPTKGNLMNIKKSLELAKMGFELLDKKRNILIREMMSLVDTAKALRSEISGTYGRAYFALQRANVTLGILQEIANTTPVEESLHVHYRSVMGVELPIVSIDDVEEYKITYGFAGTNSQLDIAYLSFHKVKVLTVQLAEVENSVYRLADAIKKTQGRANALKNIIIPNFEAAAKSITESLEEKEREEFARLKVIKAKKNAEEENENIDEIFEEIEMLRNDPYINEKENL